MLPRYHYQNNNNVCPLRELGDSRPDKVVSLSLILRNSHPRTPRPEHTKKSLYSKLEPLCQALAVLTTGSSTLKKIAKHLHLERTVF